MNIWPCHGCPLREGCARGDYVSREYHGLPRDVRAIGIRVRCGGELVSELRPGRRVEITHPFRVAKAYSWAPNEFVTERRLVRATIKTVYKETYEFLAIIDDGQGVEGQLRFRRKQKHTRIKRFLDEPDRQMCGCGWPVFEGIADIIPTQDCLCGEMLAAQVAAKMNPNLYLCPASSEAF